MRHKYTITIESTDDTIHQPYFVSLDRNKREIWSCDGAQLKPLLRSAMAVIYQNEKEEGAVRK